MQRFESISSVYFLLFIIVFPYTFLTVTKVSWKAALPETSSS